MGLILSLKDLCVIYGSLGAHLNCVSNFEFYGGEVGSSAVIIEKYLSDLHDRVYDALISAADDEANSLVLVEIDSKCTDSDLKQSSAGDKVSLDQHIQLYREVFND